jgi:carbon storage regulator
MLVLSRQRDETIMIGDDIEITIVDIRGDKVRLGITAPATVPVHRKEVYEAIQRENREAARVKMEDLPSLPKGSRPAAVPPGLHRPAPGQRPPPQNPGQPHAPNAPAAGQQPATERKDAPNQQVPPNNPPAQGSTPPAAPPAAGNSTPGK